MIIHITKLHLILFFTAVMITMYFFLLQNQQYSFLNYFDRVEKPPVEAVEPPPVRDIATIRHNTRKVIAVAGEEMKIAVHKGKNVSAGKALLRQAKRLEQEGEYTRAVNIALQSIDVFKAKTAKIVKLSGYTVKRGDCLWNISKRKDIYGKGSGWVTIWRANEKRIPDFDEIYSGQKLTIPRN